eukprot:2587932-Rhodomonas_salina.1
MQHQVLSVLLGPDEEEEEDELVSVEEEEELPPEAAILLQDRKLSTTSVGPGGELQNLQSCNASTASGGADE